MVAQGVGTFLSYKGEKQIGKAQADLANFEAAQLDQNAGQVQAAGQRAAEEERRKTTLLLSRAQAVAAASGAGTLDPSVLKVIAGVAGEGALNAATTQYNYDEQARGMRNEGKGRRYSGQLAKAASRIRANTTALSGAASMLSKWGPTWEEEKKAQGFTGYDYGSSKAPSEFYNG
jgi:hypothetical protein